MSNLTQMRLAAREIFDEALRALDAGAAVSLAMNLERSRLNICDVAIDLANRNIYSISIGKAAFPMASALEEILGNRIAAGVIASNAPGYRSARRSERVNEAQVANLRHKVFYGGHPEPNEQSLAAAQASFDILAHANAERALVIFLISGGGSAMLEWPISEDIPLWDLGVAHKALVNSGASISEINAVRRAFSAVKGGRLAARAPHCDQITLIISDVPSGEERNVASGPTLAPPPDAPDARDVIVRYNFRLQLPETVLRAVDAEPNDSQSSAGNSTQLRKHFVLLDNKTALEAAAEAARRRGFITKIASEMPDQRIESGCAELLNRLSQPGERAGNEELSHDSPTSVCLISGGEFGCQVHGDGIGGRNLETALRLAIEYDKLQNQERAAKESHFVALCAGTDGIDGNSPAAGAIVDKTTIERARAVGLDPQKFLDRSDAYSFFVALGDAIATGPTGTNVRDLRILLAS